MASMIDAYRDAFSEDFAYLKFVLFAIPVYFVFHFYSIGQIAMFNTFAPILGILIFGLFTQAIYNVKANRKEVLTINPIEFIFGLIKTLVVMVPNLLIFGTIGYYVTRYNFPVQGVPHFNDIFHIIVWLICGSIILTSYLAFAKFQSIKQGFNYKVIFESCADVFLQLLFMIPQLAIVNLLLVGPVAYLYFFFKVPFEHWTFAAYCSCVFVINISVLGNYFAQISTEHVKGDDSEYQFNTSFGDVTGDSVDVNFQRNVMNTIVNNIKKDNNFNNKK